MYIEAIVQKHTNKTGWAFAHDSCEKSMRAALTELAAGYEQSLERLSQINAGRLDLIHRQEERIRQLEAERVPEFLSPDMRLSLQYIKGLECEAMQDLLWRALRKHLLAAAQQKKKEGMK